MQYAFKKDVFTVATVNGDFELHKIDGTVYGDEGDLVATNLEGDKFLVNKEDFEKHCVKVDRVGEIDKDEMAKIYQEMGSINLEISNEGFGMEVEADETIHKMLKSDW